MTGKRGLILLEKLSRRRHKEGNPEIKKEAEKKYPVRKAWRWKTTVWVGNKGVGSRQACRGRAGP